MRAHQKTTLLVLITLVVTAATTLTTLRGRSQNSSPTKQQKEEERDKRRLEYDKRRLELEKEFPTVDYEVPDSGDSEKRAKRKIKNSRYDSHRLVGDGSRPDIGETSLTYDWEFTVPALPAGQSDVIVVGEVLNAEAHLSNDRSGVYTEFTIKVEEVLKGDKSSPPSTDNSITVDRPGGFVRYPAGHKHLYRHTGQNMPRVGLRYLLFLNTSGESPNYRILTGYKLGASGVSPLDSPRKFAVYKGVDETTFLTAVRETITQSSQTTPEE